MFVPSTAEVLRACDVVLTQELKPIHYRKLAEMALRYLGYNLADINMFRVIEDVREQLPMRNYNDIVYTGKPLFAMVKMRWFNTLQLQLTQTESIRIKGSAIDGANGAFEALMRSPYMIDKWNGNTEKRNRQRSNGLVIEHHVIGYFKRTWPEFYREPVNFCQWQRPCSHDFQLRINGSLIGIDITGPGQYGYNGKYKKSTDLHLLCEIDNQDILWTGVIKGSEYNDLVLPEQTNSPERIAVWLNCCKSNIDYRSLIELCFSIA